ncbi:class I SAM-dependent methyltransferase [Agarivorans gilvus]|jgi:cyclopropane fatty-acyl-phospholipid synthase-like methyltransferase|uniref:SAM-dependent methyltransferase n=1 Tax=Agarivorans gilvus TaxID=680279 RepID=A0ABQ1I100_9ALTE|nr:class I SAM-dependent methyltransferase [Agarivorans gilvus]GGB02131.1 SAM-dependent methyltransferase [Agarivorans gilvus]
MWDQRYQRSDYIYGTSANDFLRAESSAILQRGKVLCLAEGEGRNAVYLASQGYQVTAVDQSAVGLEKAQLLAKQHDVTIHTEVADLATYDLGEECWDGIVSIFAHMPAPLRKDLHQRCVKALKNTGVFLLEAFTKRQLETEGRGGPPAEQLDFFMSLEHLKLELAGLEFSIGRELTRYIDEGHYHQGESSVVQVLAIK